MFTWMSTILEKIANKWKLYKAYVPGYYVQCSKCNFFLVLHSYSCNYRVACCDKPNDFFELYYKRQMHIFWLREYVFYLVNSGKVFNSHMLCKQSLQPVGNRNPHVDDSDHYRMSEHFVMVGIKISVPCHSCLFELVVCHMVFAATAMKNRVLH